MAKEAAISHDHVRVGDLLRVSAPRGSFTLAPGNGPVVFISAGIGATPVLAMLHSIANDAANSTRRLWWLYGARDSTLHPFAEEARTLLRSLTGSRSYIAYSSPRDGDVSGMHYDVAGHLDISVLQQLEVPKEADFYLCGPSTFLSDFASGLAAWGIPESQIRSEVFGAGTSMTPGIANSTAVSPHIPVDGAGVGPKVSFTRSGLTVPWDSRYESLLEFAEACDVPVKWSCRMGVCHTCETALIDGGISYTSEPLDRPGEGNVLICCSIPLTAIELDL